MDPPEQILRVLPVLVFPQEGIVSRQVAREHKIKQAPQLPDAVLHRSAGQGKPGIGLQLFDCLCRHAAGVFDILGFIQDHEAEGIILHQGDIPPDQRIAGDHHIHVPVRGEMPDQPGPLGAVPGQDRNAQVGSELAELTQPVIGQGRRGYDQAGPAGFPGRLQQGDDLRRLAQAHIVRKDAAHAHAIQRKHPVISALLVIPQGNPRGECRRGRFAPAVLQRFRKLRDVLVQFDLQAAVLQHAGQVAGPVRAQHDGVPVQFISVPDRRLIDAGRCFLPAGQIVQVQEFAGP